MEGGKEKKLFGMFWDLFGYLEMEFEALLCNK
jgi:hypothetical protein